MPAASALTTLQHVIRNVMKVDESKTHLEEALTHDDFVDLASLLALERTDMTDLKWVHTDDDGNPTDHHMTKGTVGKIEAFQSFVCHLGETKRSPTTDQDWFNLTADMFNAHRVSPEFLGVRLGRIPKSQKDPVAEFKRCLLYTSDAADD